MFVHNEWRIGDASGLQSTPPVQLQPSVLPVYSTLGRRTWYLFESFCFDAVGDCQRCVKLYKGLPQQYIVKPYRVTHRSLRHLYRCIIHQAYIEFLTVSFFRELLVLLV